MASFIGRYEELERLDEVYEGNIRNCYIDAKPRSGATALAKRFCEKSKCIYTTFRESTPRESVKAFKDAIENFTNEPLDDREYTFADLFHILTKVTKEYDPIIVFDGTNYAPEDFPAQVKFFSENEDHMIILIGNGDADRFDITFSDIIYLNKLSRKECGLFHPKMSSVDTMKTYMAVGDSPLYHSLMNKADFATSVEKNFLGNCPKLSMECELILRKSNVPYPICCAILTDIANCIGRPVDIADREGISRQLCDIYLKKLVEENIIRTLTAIGNSPKKPVYIIRNPLIAFYFIAIRRNPEIEFRNKTEYKDIERYVDMFLELRFRDVCEQYFLNHYKVLKIGRWWQKEEDTYKPTLTAIVEIDGEQRTMVADCKFRGGKIDQGALKTFSARAEMIEDVPDKVLVMFSISGFEDKLLKKARNENVLLIGPNELL